MSLISGRGVESSGMSLLSGRKSWQIRKSDLAPVGSFFGIRKNGVLNVVGVVTGSMTSSRSHASSLPLIASCRACANGNWRWKVT